jgi:hypothetical protein
MKNVGRLIASAAVAALAATSSLALGAAPTLSGFTDQSTLIEHIVSPLATDPSIAQAFDDHYAWLDSSASMNHQLLLYLPGTDGVPANALLIQQMAARLGYHVIGLMYPDSAPPNFASIVPACAAQPDPNACDYATRLEILTGTAQPDSLMTVGMPDSIVNRLTKLLAYLTANYPAEGWANFLSDGVPRWSAIAATGLSLGGGEAALIGSLHVVARVVMFSAVAANYGGQPPTWESASHLTPTDRYWGLAHDQDPAYQSILMSWTALGLPRFGQLVQVENSAPPYEGTHILFTDLKPQREGYKAAHVSTVIDFYTPLNRDHTPALSDAWRYLMTAS